MNAPGASRVRLLLLYISSGLMVFVAAPPFGFGPIAFFSLVPMLYAARLSHSYRFAALGGLLAGAGLFVPGVFWMSNVSWAAYAALAVYCSSYLILFAILVRAARKTSPFWNAALAGSCWIVLEVIRGHLMTGFPWLLLSHTQYSFTTFAQIVDVVGAYGLSGIIVILNALLFSALFMRRRAPAIVALGLFTLVCVYGYIRIHTVKVEPLLKVAMVQASVPQELKELISGKYDPTEALQRYIDVSRSIPTSEKIDMIVWPETVLLFPYTLNVEPGVFTKTYADGARFAQDSLKTLARKYQAYVLAGATSYLPAEYGYVSDPRIALQIPSGAWNKRYNSAYLVDPDGVYKARYDKIHLVPFGEYLPLPNLFPFFSKLVPFTEFLLPGDKQTIFNVNAREHEAHFGVLICYEDMDPELARGLRLRGSDFFVNISNDAWFATSIELDQHFAVARLRAIENRVGVVRAGNNGITGIIDPLGRIQALFQKNADGITLTKDVTGYLIGTVSTSDTVSLYTRVGDMPELAVSALALIWFGLASWRSRGSHR